MTDTTARLAQFTADTESMKTFVYAEAAHRSRSAFMGPLTAGEYGKIMAKMGDMAGRSAKLAFLASLVMPKINLYGTRAQVCAAIFAAMRETMTEDFVDVYRATAPDASRLSAHTHPWTLTDKVIARAWANVLTAGLTDSAPGHGWALTDLAASLNVQLPRI